MRIKKNTYVLCVLFSCPAWAFQLAPSGSAFEEKLRKLFTNRFWLCRSVARSKRHLLWVIGRGRQGSTFCSRKRISHSLNCSGAKTAPTNVEWRGPLNTNGAVWRKLKKINDLRLLGF